MEHFLFVAPPPPAARPKKIIFIFFVYKSPTKLGSCMAEGHAGLPRLAARLWR